MISMVLSQNFARIPPYLERYRRAKEEEQRRWEEERREEARRLENMKLSDEERDKILQVTIQIRLESDKFVILLELCAQCAMMQLPKNTYTYSKCSSPPWAHLHKNDQVLYTKSNLAV